MINRPIKARLASYLAGSTFLLFSEGLYDLAFAIYAYQISGKASVGAITYALGYLSEILVSLFGGGYLDRVSKLRIYTFTILLKVVLFISLFFWGREIGLSEIAIWCFAFLIDAVHHYSKLNNVMAIADLFEERDLVQAHGSVAAVHGISRIGGPLIGAGLVGWLGAINALAFCAVFQLTALVFFYASFCGVVRKTETSGSVSPSAPVFDTVRALKEIWQSSHWRRYLALDAATTLFTGTSVLLMVPLLKEMLRVSDDQVGLFFSVGAAGAIAGGVFLSRAFRRFRFHRWMAGIVFLQGFFLLALVHSGGFYVAVGVKFLLDFMITAYYRSTAVYLQTEAPQEKRGAYYTGADAVSRTLGLVGIVSGGFLFDKFGYVALYTVLAAGLFSLALLWCTAFDQKTVRH
ncbi:MAG: MFS transporter [Bdellovibrionales bacterium]|nr:MFS transporter [Bdellovibrionales bacterium]